MLINKIINLKLKSSKNDQRRHVFRSYLAAYQLLEDLKVTHAGRKIRMLDIGGAHGIHTRFFRRNGIDVTLVDIKAGDEKPAFIGDYIKYRPKKPFDVIWSSHVLEHIQNPSEFLCKMNKDLADDGYCVVTVPPLREEKMGHAHISLWNAGLLLLNALKAGFEPKTVRLANYGYNLSMIIRKRLDPMPKGYLDNFPPSMKTKSPQHFKGDVEFVNWDVKEDKLPLLSEVFENEQVALETINKKSKVYSFCKVQVKKVVKMYYYDKERDALYDCG